MPLNLEALDDEPIAEGLLLFNGGLNSYERRSALAENQYRDGTNVLFNREGRIETRRGSLRLGPLYAAAYEPYGLAFFKSGATELLVGAAQLAGVDRIFTQTFTTGAGNTNIGVCSPGLMHMAQGNDKIYLGNGIDAMKSYDTGAGLVTYLTGATDPPKAKFLVWGTNRLIAAGVPTAPDTVYFSNILNPGNAQWPANQTIRVGAGDGQEITGLAMWTKTLLVVFKRASVWIVDINPVNTVATFPIDEVPASVGCVSHRSIARVGRDLWFFAPDGVRSLSRVLQGEDNEVSAAFSRPIRDQLEFIMDATFAAFAEKINAVYYRGRYLLSVPVNNSGPNTVFAYNVAAQCWEGRWTLLASPLCRTLFSNFEQLCWLDTTGRKVMSWQDYTTEPSELLATLYEDDGGAIIPVFTTRNFAFKAPKNPKQGFEVEFEFEKHATYTPSVTVYASIDDAAGIELGTVVVAAGAGSQRASFTLLHLVPFREIAFQLVGQRKFELRTITATAFLQTMAVGS